MDLLDNLGPDDGDSAIGAHEHRIVSLVPAAPQTRAAYLDPQRERGYFLVIVVAWALWSCEDCGSRWTSAMVQTGDGSGNTLERVTAWPNYWQVLGAGEPDPSAEQAWAELRRRETEERREEAAEELEELFALPAVSEAERAANKPAAPEPVEARRAREAVALAQGWPSWRPDYDAQTAYAAALDKAWRKPSASLKALAQTARYAAELAAKAP